MLKIFNKNLDINKKESLKIIYFYPLNTNLKEFNNIDNSSRELLSILINKMNKNICKLNNDYYLNNTMYKIVKMCELGLNNEEPIIDIMNFYHEFGIGDFAYENEMKLIFYEYIDNIFKYIKTIDFGESIILKILKLNNHYYLIK